MRTVTFPLWAWWGLAVVVVSLPWVGFTARPQWDRVHVLPFTDPEDSLRDLAANIAAFVPFGILFSTERSITGFARVVLAAGAVSFVAEASQLFSSARNPSATDVLAAVAGATSGRALRHGLARVAPGRRTS